MLLALRSLWEEQPNVITGTSAATATPGTSAATGTTTSESRSGGGRRKRRLPKPRRIVQWSAIAPIRRPAPVGIAGRAELRATSGTFCGQGQLGTDADALGRDEAFLLLLMEA